MRVLLMGNPNVGKSALFTRITGTNAVVSNYAGTTVGFTKGSMKLGNEEVEVIDVPGTYSLEPTSKAEEVAAKMLLEGDVVINVVDATNLERNLYLTLELLEKGVPVVVALNMWDDTSHRGITVDIAKLESLLEVPVAPTVAVSGQGIKELVERIPEARSPKPAPRTKAERWAAVGGIITEAQTLAHRHHTWLERLQDASLKPRTGIPIAIFALAASFLAVRGVGEGLIRYITDPLFHRLWEPLMMRLSDALGGSGFWHNVLVGKLSDGTINFQQSMGVLTTGLYIEFGIVLPYILIFYLVLGLMEDIGYLPRLAVLLDSIMHRLGMHGYAIIPSMMGMGCAVPALMATRILESKRERFIAATLICIAIPCAASQAMIFGLVGAKGWQYVALVFGIHFIVWLVLGLILNRMVKGFSPELLIEIPPYRLPSLRGVTTKLWLRVWSFLKEALPIIMGAIFIVSILYSLGIFDAIANFTAPLVSGIFGLPKEAVVAIIVGFMRKDIAIGMLAPLGLSAGQLVVGTVVLSMFFPCVAALVIFAKELGLKRLLAALAIMIVSTIIVGGLLNLAL